MRRLAPIVLLIALVALVASPGCRNDREMIREHRQRLAEEEDLSACRAGVDAWTQRALT